MASSTVSIFPLVQLLLLLRFHFSFPFLFPLSYFTFLVLLSRLLSLIFSVYTLEYRITGGGNNRGHGNFWKTNERRVGIKSSSEKMDGIENRKQKLLK